MCCCEPLCNFFVFPPEWRAGKVESVCERMRRERHDASLFGATRSRRRWKKARNRGLFVGHLSEKRLGELVRSQKSEDLTRALGARRSTRRDLAVDVGERGRRPLLYTAHPDSRASTMTSQMTSRPALTEDAPGSTAQNAPDAEISHRFYAKLTRLGGRRPLPFCPMPLARVAERAGGAEYVEKERGCELGA